MTQNISFYLSYYSNQYIPLLYTLHTHCLHFPSRGHLTLSLQFSFGHWLSYPLDFFQGVGRGGLFFLFYPKKLFFFFSSGPWFEIILALVTDQGVFWGFFLVPWILVDSRLVNIYIYIYIYIYIITLIKKSIKVNVFMPLIWAYYMLWLLVIITYPH